MTFINSKIDELKPMVVNPNYGEIASLLIESKLKACSDEYFILVFEKNWQVDNFNYNLKKVEELFKKIDFNYKCIAVDENEWEDIKNKFNNKLIKFEYKSESDESLNFIKNNQLNGTDIEKLFGNMIEYM
jgi:hypothetical protein